MARPNESSRLKGMLSAIHAISKPGVYTFEDLAKIFNCSIDDAKKTMIDLSDCSLDDIYLDFFFLDDSSDVEGICVTGALDGLSNAIRLTSDESFALLCAMQFAGVEPSSSLVEKISRCAFSSASDSAFGVSIDFAMQSKLAGTLQMLCLQHRHCIIEYMKPGASEAKTIKLCPIELQVSVEGFFYLRACVDSENEIKSYRLDRIMSIEPMASHFNLDASFTSDESETREIVLRMPADEQFDLRIWKGCERIGNSNGFKRYKTTINSGSDWVSNQIVSRLGRIEIECIDDDLGESIRRNAAKRLNDIRKARDEFAKFA